MAECWVSDFAAFFAHIGPAPTKKHWLDRKDNDKGYEPNNVIWSTPQQQNRNRSTNVMIEIDGVSKCMAEWCQQNGVSRITANYRIKKGMNPALAVTLPPDASKSRAVR